MIAKTLDEEADLRFHINRAELWIRDRVLLGDQKETVFTLMVASRILLKRDKEIEELRAEVNDWRESARKASGERCEDEIHCCCVPYLRVEIDRLRARVNELEDNEYNPF